MPDFPEAMTPSPEERANALASWICFHRHQFSINDVEQKAAQAIREAVLTELEKRAKVADKIASNPPTAPQGRHPDWQAGWQDGAMEIAAALRAPPGEGNYIPL